MTTDPQTAIDFDGCNRKCRLAGAHTLVWGACEHAAQPEPAVSLSRVYTAADGFPSIGFDTYTVQQLGELITAGVRASDLPVNGDDLVDVGLVAAHAIFNRNAAAPAAVPVAAPPTTEQEAGEDQPETPLEKRLRYSERRNDELRTECLRRGKTVLEQAEKIVALERQIDEVRSQLGAEILRAGQAEAELRRLAVAAEAGGPSREATEPQPTAYSDGKGRAYCLACPRPFAATVPLTVEDVDHYETCWACERPLVDVARTAAPAVSSRPGTEQEAEDRG